MNKRKGISLIVLVITILVMIILAGVVVVSLQQNNPIDKAKEARFKTNVVSYLDELNMMLLGEEYASGVKVINKTGNLKEFIPSFKKEDEGKFEIKNNKLGYIGDNYSEFEMAEEVGAIHTDYPKPRLSKILTPIKYNEKNVDSYTKFNDPEWYDYTNITMPKYANAKTKNGSYYVWIPRFAYRIIYYDTEANKNAAKSVEIGNPEREKNAIGFSDIRGIVNKNGELDTSFDRSQFIIEVEFLGNSNAPNSYKDKDGKFKYDVTKNKGIDNPRGLVIHPAFTNFRRNNLKYAEGNYGEVKDINGFWISKFEMSNGSYPNKSSERSMDVSSVFKKARNVVKDKKLESMTLTNTKWGAVIYLTYFNQVQEKFALYKNNNDYITGGKNYKVNVGQSNTNNITGVYDLNGGSYETTASYLKNSSSVLDVYCKKLLENANTRYVDVYKKGNVGEETYKENGDRYGDAIFELSNNKGAIPYGDDPVYYVGNSHYDEDNSFIRITRGTGEPYGSTSWRSIILEK